MHVLIIRHVEGIGPARFVVQRATDFKAGEPVEVQDPVTWLVEGQPRGLLSELRWYLEDFLDYPFDPWTERAARVEAAVRAWGRAAFEALLGSGRARDFYRDAVRDGPEKLQVQMRSDDPRVLAWPWEALEDGEAAPLALTGQVERSLDKVADPAPLPAELPLDRVNILLVIARPFEGDVGYRSIARELVELVDKRSLPAHVTVLRPPTFARLQEVLAEAPHMFHLLHFDGHGGYGHTTGPAGIDGHRLQNVQGRLVFETEDGSPDPVDAGRLADLLRVHRLPTVVLSACQSAMLDERAEDPFASVAGALLKGGVRSVVAMAWSLYVSGAQQFLPAFYETLFKTGDVGQAARAGRRKMREQPSRVCARGLFPLSDWLVPVVYQQAAFAFAFATAAPPPEKRAPLPEEARDEENPYGFVGRDSALLALERAMRRKPAGILIHGLGGVGKTTLACGFLHWLAQTGGLGRGAFWFTFNDIRSAEHVVNRMAGALFDTNALTEPMAAKVDALARSLRETPFVIVWDNFESARGIDGTQECGLLPAEDLAWLRQLLAKLRGGRTKVLITSRSDEAWLGADLRFKLDLGGLHGEERWAFCQAILADLGRNADMNDRELVALMNVLDGHPLMMRMVLPRLEGRSAGQVLTALRSNLAELGLSGHVLHEKLTATLRFVQQGLPDALRPLCVLVGLHERFLVAPDLALMAAAVGGAWGAEHIDRFLQMLAVAGLVMPRGRVYALHPALTGYLRSIPNEVDQALWERAFVDRMGRFADFAAPRPLHEQRKVFVVFHANFHHALRLAGMHAMDMHILALTQCLAAYALNTRDYVEAERLLTALAEHARGHLNLAVEASACHQLGVVAFRRREFAAAETWYLKSLAITEKLGHKHGAAMSCHQLGMVAQELRNFETAEVWYFKSLTISEQQRNEHDATITYHQLGMVAQERGNFEAAETWYRKSLAIAEKQGDKHGAAQTYHQLGRVAEERRAFEAAEKWYLKSLAIKEKLGDEYADIYHQLGMVAQGRQEFDAAETWYLKSLAITEKGGDAHAAARTCGQLGILAQLRGDHASSADWLIRFVQAFLRTCDPAGTEGDVRRFLILESTAPTELRPRLRAMWAEAGFAPPPEPGDESPPLRAPERRPTGRKPLPENLPRVEIEIVPPEVRHAGLDAYRRIGQEVSEVLERRPTSLVVVRIVRPQFIRKDLASEPNDKVTVETADPPERPIVRGLAGPGMLAITIVHRWQDHLPVHRLESIYARDGLDLSHSTICGWHEQLADLAEPLVEAMLHDAFTQPYLCTDTTGVLVQAAEQCRRAHFWVLVAPERHVVYRFSPKHDRDAVARLLAGYKGYLVADAASVFDHLYAAGDVVVEVACWCHLRRYFCKALGSDQERAEHGLSLIRAMYKIERMIKDEPRKKREKTRRDKARPIVDAFFQWCDQQAAHVLPGTLIAKAIGYARNQRTAFRRFLDDGRLPMDNNISERALRREVVGRKSWLFLGSDEGTRVNTVFVSLLASCQLHGIEPWAYLRDLLCLLPSWPASRVLELAPAFWQQTLQQEDIQQRLAANVFRGVSILNHAPPT